jgi:thiol-disulfide isomerase/thioredoxin
VRILRFVGLSGVLLAAAACGHATFPESTQHPLLAKPFPEIRHRQTLDGAAFDPTQAQGKVVVVKFFAEYCIPCKETLPAAERIHEANGDVLFLGIDEDESTETARTLVAHYGITFPVIHDASNVLSGRFRVSSMPTTFVVDRTGVVRWVGGEGQTESDIAQAVAAAK